ncbi:glycosyltransferase [Robertmurraya siralis]|uniref:glycosyltransferase n=1 Tax=Robertmurraya siralis TaxID=77777 RepID=UPI0010F7593B|nr:glycosyltransferase [Robertmurraya siralis]
MRKRKVAIVVPSFVIGGAEKMVYQLAAALDRNEFVLKLISLSPPQYTFFEEELQKQGLDLVFLNNRGKLSLKTVALVWRELSKFKADIVHTHLHAFLYVFPWVCTHSASMLQTIHSTPKVEFSSKLIFLMERLYKLKKAIPVAISSTIRKEASELYKLPLDEVELVYNPVQLVKYRETSFSNEAITYINVARLEPIKNHKLLLQAFSIINRELPQASLILVGDGKEKKTLEENAVELGIKDKVVFTGNVSNVEDYLARSDIFVLTSIYEGLPLAILEAMASGLPIIATNVGGIADVIKGNGLLVESGDLLALSDGMLELARDKEKRVQMSKCSKENVKAYDVAIVAQKYGELYKKYG